MKLLTVLIGALALSASLVSAAVEYTHTPQGRMRADCVHTVPSGSVVRAPAAGTAAASHDWMHVFAEDGTTFLRSLPRCKNTKQHPLMERDAIRKAQGGALADGSSSSRVASRKLMQDTTYDGWTAYTAFNTPKGIDTFLGSFSVPDMPLAPPEVLYLFTGLQNVNYIPVVDPDDPSFDIIQPVLQYPCNSCQGNQWSVKSWYVSDQSALNSDELQVSVGDSIFGNMTQTPGTPSEWTIASVLTSTGQSTVLTVDQPRLTSQPWAYNTLECYGCTSCYTYPQKPCEFTSLSLSLAGEEITPEWLLNPQQSSNRFCAENVTDITPFAQNIVFQQQ